MEALLKRSRNPAAFCHRTRSRRITKHQAPGIVPGHVQNTESWMAMLDREQPIICPDTHHHQQHQRVEVASRPASPAPCESKRLGAPTNRTFVPKSFARKTVEHDGGADERARHEEAFRNGLKRNIVHLSNVTRVNQELLARLREQLRVKDVEITSLQGAIEKANALQAAQEELRAGEIVPDIAPIQNVSMFGSMAMFASKVAAGSRQTRDRCEDKTEIVLMGERSAAAAMGAKHTEEQLLRANRDIRSQLERALQKAEAHRVDELSAIARAEAGEKEKADLEARLACLSGELKLQAAPLTAMQLELTQAKLDTETMRERLKNHRKESRLRIDDCERIGFENQERMQRVDLDLAGIVKACQRESLRASKYERMFQDASAAGQRLKAELEQAKADARRTAQELSRVQAQGEGCSRVPPLTLACAVPGSSKGRDRGDGVGEGGEGAKENVEQADGTHVAALKDEVRGLRAKLAESERARTEEINSYRHNAARSEETVAQLHKDRAKSENLVKELSRLHRGETEEHARALKAVEERTASLTEENSRLRCLVEVNEQARREQEKEPSGLMTSRASLSPHQVQSARARLCRTVDDLCGAEEATELVLTCLLCARLFRDPQVMTPCGHTLCADCCGGGSGSGGTYQGTYQGTPTPDGEEEAQAGRTGDSEMRASLGCRLCEKEGGAVGRASVGEGQGMAPNHAVQALVAKHTFRRQLLQVLRRTNAVLSQDAPRIL